MKTVNEVHKLTGVSIRMLQYYDTIGLLRPTQYTDAGYRLYDDAALARLGQILLFRELEFPLKEIKQILDSPNFDRKLAVEQQLTLLQLKKEHLENLITFTRGLKAMGDKAMDFSAFTTEKMDAYKKQAKEKWGSTAAYKQFESKSKGRSSETENAMGAGLMLFFQEFGKLKGSLPSSPAAQAQVQKLQSYITENYYDCTTEMLSGLGQMYACSGAFTDSIDQAGGAGTAAFTAEAICFYCKSN
ncbi:MAG: MerR family transcriptional regulator [Oscillospiraceae bacterium]|jgi:DNA-binding transcriptional MerR regulator|nr:MerR family transcriptional regulator [Oscillospiraceae bacterium]